MGLLNIQFPKGAGVFFRIKAKCWVFKVLEELDRERRKILEELNCEKINWVEMEIGLVRP